MWARRLKYVFSFEQANIVAAAIQVVRQQVEHARNHRRAHHRSLIVQRVREVEFDGGRKARGVVFRNEGKRNGFVVTECKQGSAEPRVFARIGQFANLAAVGGKRVRELV